MRRPNALRRMTAWGWGLAAVALLSIGADEPKQTVDAGGLKFEAPKSWKSSPPTSQMRRAELKVEPIEGDGYPAELIVFAIRGGGWFGRGQPQALAELVQGRGRQPARIESKKVKGKNVEVVRAETHGEYNPPQFPGGPQQPVRKGARLLGAIVTTDAANYYIRMVGPDKTMKKLTADFDEMLKTIQVGRIERIRAAHRPTRCGGFPVRTPLDRRRG